MSKVRLFISESYDPWFNLAVEETIFRSMAIGQKVLFLWRNADTVVIGRGQNPWRECNTAKIEDDGVKLVRRSSGGGAVFHDLGNLNFTFMAGKPEYDKAISTQIIIDALKNIGIFVDHSGRNDLILLHDGEIKKISGSAYRETQDRGFHHGTVLIDVDFTRLGDYLNPDLKKLQAKGITSVRSRVANLIEVDPSITPQKVQEAIMDEFFHFYGESVSAEYISEKSPPKIEGFAEHYRKQSSWEWNFGGVLEFTHTMDERFPWGGVEVQLKVDKGMIVQAKIYTDSLYVPPFETLSEKLEGVQYTPHTVSKKCDEVISGFPDFREEFSTFQHWFIKEIR